MSRGFARGGAEAGSIGERLTVAFRAITYNNKPLTLHKATVHPEFNERTVLVTSTWDYVALWLRRRRKADALFFWEQARHFHDATLALPKVSAPLTAYYSFLNATKALLLANGVSVGDYHGVTGETLPGKTSLSHEQVELQAGGVLGALAKFLGEPTKGELLLLKNVLYNLVYVHRTFSLTFKSAPELFVPIKRPRIVRSNTTHESWFCGELEGKYARQSTVKSLGKHFERDASVTDAFVVRYKPRFNWEPRKKVASLTRYLAYHKKLRARLQYIHSPQRLWYIKRAGALPGLESRSSLVLAFAAMHRLSELSRYSPDCLSRHFEGQHNWLLSEFISVAPIQFIDELSSELTGLEFMIPGRVASSNRP